MIKLTRLAGELFILNADKILYVECRPDTYVTLEGGERVMVAESMDEVMRRAVVYQQTKQLIPRLEGGETKAEGGGRKAEGRER